MVLLKFGQSHPPFGFPIRIGRRHRLTHAPVEKIIEATKELILDSIKTSSFTRAKLSPRLLIALKKLKSNLDIVIMAVDKNLGLVILDCEWYMKEGNR